MNKLIRKILLYPLGIVYNIITKTRNIFYDIGIKKTTSFNIPIICIGNITVGGTGKTPHTEYIIRLLQEKHNIATLSRGYGRKTKNYIEANIYSTSKEVGDEPAQYKRKFPNVIVVSENKRVKGVENIKLNHPKTEIILLDDAFQHRKIKAGLNIVITDYNNIIYKDFLLPAGNLRESKKGVNRADIIIVSKCPNNISTEEQEYIKTKLKFKKINHIYFTYTKYGKIYNIFNNIILPLDKNKYDVLIITGIGNPKPLINYATQQFNSITCISYKDHHEYNNNNIKTILNKFDEIESKNKIILTTEKDASRMLKIKEFKTTPIFCIEIIVEFINKKNKFNTEIKEYVRTNKTNS